MNKYLLTAAALLALGGAIPAKAATTFDTFASWDGGIATGDQISSFGPSPASPTYGQTFVAPADNVLTSFTFYLDASAGTIGAIQFTPYVFAWTGSLFGGDPGGGNATGSPLYSGTSTQITGGMQGVTISTGTLALVSGDQYIAFFTTTNTADDAFDNAVGAASGWGNTQYTHVANDGDGGFVYNNSASFSDLTASDWGDAGDFGDLAWKATFVAGSVEISSVDEPASMLLFAAGLFGIGLIRYNKRV